MVPILYIYVGTTTSPTDIMTKIAQQRWNATWAMKSKSTTSSDRKIEKRSRMVANNDDYNRETQKGSLFLARHSQVKQYDSMIRW